MVVIYLNTHCRVQTKPEVIQARQEEIKLLFQTWDRHANRFLPIAQLDTAPAVIRPQDLYRYNPYRNARAEAREHQIGERLKQSELES